MFPAEIFFETRDDLLRFIKKSDEFERFISAIGCIRATLPELEQWVLRNLRAVITIAPEVEGLVEVAAYLRDNPRPGCFARELPLSVDTKFIERHRVILNQWLDIVMPAYMIRADEDHFERRFGLRYAEPQLLIRFLDRDVQEELGFPCEVLSLPLHTLSELPVRKANVIVVENKVNLLTLPRMNRYIGLGGLGRAITLLRYVKFMAEIPITYWGDIDVEGFEILSSLRVFCPDAASLWMDERAIGRWRDLATTGSGRMPSEPAHLTDAEKAAFFICSHENMRIEQERLPHREVLATLKATQMQGDSSAT